MSEYLVKSADTAQFPEQISAIYQSFAQRQERLGEEFEAAIFGDLESLYEALKEAQAENSVLKERVVELEEEIEAIYRDKAGESI